jgi:hypothetical protein
MCTASIGPQNASVSVQKYKVPDGLYDYQLAGTVIVDVTLFLCEPCDGVTKDYISFFPSALDVSGNSSLSCNAMATDPLYELQCTPT